MTPLKANFFFTSQQLIILGNTSRKLSSCSMIDIGSNLDRVTCWQDRTGPPVSWKTKAHHAQDVMGSPSSSSGDDGQGRHGVHGDHDDHHPFQEAGEGCDFLRKEVERDDCWRKRAAEIAFVVLLVGTYVYRTTVVSIP